MKFLEKVAENKHIIIYNAGELSNVTDELVAAVKWPKEVELLAFCFKPFPTKGGYVRHNLKSDYVIRHLYGGKTSSLKPLGKAMKNSPIIARAPKNAAEALKVTIDTLGRDTSSKYNKSGPAYHRERKRYYDMIKKGEVKSVLIFKNERNVGIASLIDVPKIGGGKASTFTWSWFDKRLPKSEYEDVRYKATKWVLDNSQPFMASVNFDYNKESQKADSCLGLKPYRINFARKK